MVIRTFGRKSQCLTTSSLFPCAELKVGVSSNHRLSIDTRPNATLASFGKPWRGRRTWAGNICPVPMISRNFSHLCGEIRFENGMRKCPIFPSLSNPSGVKKKTRRQLAVFDWENGSKIFSKNANSNQPPIFVRVFRTIHNKSHKKWDARMIKVHLFLMTTLKNMCRFTFDKNTCWI